MKSRKNSHFVGREFFHNYYVSDMLLSIHIQYLRKLTHTRRKVAPDVWVIIYKKSSTIKYLVSSLSSNCSRAARHDAEPFIKMRSSLHHKVFNTIPDKYSSDSQSTFVTSRQSQHIVDCDTCILYPKSTISNKYTIDYLSLSTSIAIWLYK